MRRALATGTIVGALALVPFTAAAAHAADDQLAAAPALTQTDDTDVDEPLAEDGNDDTGKYGLIGLTGLLGLFGYKKYREHTAARNVGGPGASGTPGTGGTTPRV